MSDRKSFVQPKQLIYLTIEDFQFDNRKIQNNFECRASINNVELDILSLHKVSLEIPIFSYEDTLTLLFIKNKNDPIGSISFLLDLFSEQKIVKRWITLFDPEDDNYDGDFLEDDTEVPRVLLNFQMSQISNEYISQDQSKYIYMSNLNLQNDVEMNSNSNNNNNYNEGNNYNVNTHNSSSSCTYNIPINNKIAQQMRSSDGMQNQDENRESTPLSSSTSKKYSKEAEATNQELEQLKKDFEQELQKIKQATLDFTNERDLFLKSQKLSSANITYENLAEKIGKQISEYVMQNNLQKKQNEQLSSLENEVYSLRANQATRDINTRDLEQKLKIMKQREEQLYLQIQALNVVIEDIKSQNQELKQQNAEMSDTFQMTDRNNFNLIELKGEFEKDIKEKYDEQMNSFDKEVRDLQEQIQKKSAKELDNESKLKEYELQFRIQEKKIQNLLQKESESTYNSQLIKQASNDKDEENYQMQQTAILEQVKKNYDLSIQNLTDILQNKDKLISELNQQLYMSLQPENDLSHSNNSFKHSKAGSSNKMSQQQDILENEVIRHAQLLQVKDTRLNELIYENNDLREKNFNLLQKLNINRSEGVTQNQMIQQKVKELEVQVSELREKNYSEYHERELIKAKYERLEIDYSEQREQMVEKDIQLAKQNMSIQDLLQDNSQIPQLRDQIDALEHTYSQLQDKLQDIEAFNREQISQNRSQEETILQMKIQKETLLQRYQEVQQKHELTIQQMDQLTFRTEQLFSDQTYLTDERDSWKMQLTNAVAEYQEKEKELQNQLHDIKQSIMLMKNNLDSVNGILNEERSMTSQLKEELIRVNSQKNAVEKQLREEQANMNELKQREEDYKKEIENLSSAIVYKHEELLQSKDSFINLSESNHEYKQQAEQNIEYMNQIIKQKQQEIEDLHLQADSFEKQIQEINSSYEIQLYQINEECECKLAQHQEITNKLLKKHSEEIEMQKNQLLKEKQEEIQNLIEQSESKLQDMENGQIRNMKVEIKQLQISLQCTEDSLRQSMESDQSKIIKIKECDGIINNLNSKIKELENRNIEMKNEQEEQNKSKLKEMNSLNEENERGIEEMKAAQRVIEEMNEQISSLTEQLILSKTQLQDTVQTYQTQLNKIENDKQDITELFVSKEEQFQNSSKQVQQLSDAITSLKNEKEQMKDNIQNLLKQIEESKSNQKLSKQQVESLKSDLDNQQILQQSSDDNQKQLLDEISQLKLSVEQKVNCIQESEDKFTSLQIEYAKQAEELTGTFTECNVLRQTIAQHLLNEKEFNQLNEQNKLQNHHLQQQFNQQLLLNESISDQIQLSQNANINLQKQVIELKEVNDNQLIQIQNQLIEQTQLTNQIQQLNQDQIQQQHLINQLKEENENMQRHYEESSSQFNIQLKEKENLINTLKQDITTLKQDQTNLKQDLTAQEQETRLIQEQLNAKLKESESQNEITLLTQKLYEKQQEVDHLMKQMEQTTQSQEIIQKQNEDQYSQRISFIELENENAEQKLVKLSHQIDEEQKKVQSLKSQLKSKDNLIQENVDQIKMINEQLILCEIKLKETRLFEKECEQKDEQIKSQQQQIILLKDQIKLLEIQSKEKDNELNKSSRISNERSQSLQESSNTINQLNDQIQSLQTQYNIIQLESSNLHEDYLALKNLSLKEKSELQESIQKITDKQNEELESFVKIIEQLEDDKKQLEDENECLKNDKDQLESDKKCLEDERQKLGDEKKQLEDGMQQLGQEKKQLEVENEQLVEDKKQFGNQKKQLEEQKIQLEDDIAQIKKQIEELKDNNDEVFTSRIKDQTKRYSELMEAHLKLDDEFNQVQEKCQSQESLLKDMQEQEVYRNAQLNDLNNVVREANALNKILSTQLEEIQKDNEEQVQKYERKMSSEKVKNEQLELQLEYTNNQLDYLNQEKLSQSEENNNLQKLQKSLERAQVENNEVLLQVERIREQNEQLKDQLEQVQADRNVLFEEVELLNKMTTLQTKFHSEEFQASYQEQLEEAHRIKGELISSLQEKERELSQKEAELQTTKLQEDSLNKKIDELRSIQEVKSKKQNQQSKQETQEFEQVMNKYSEEKCSMMQTINQLEYTIERLAKQNELLSVEIEKRDKEYINICEQLEQSDSVHQDKLQLLSSQLKEKSNEVERTQKMSEQTILALKQQIEQAEINQKNICDKMVAELKGSEQERDHALLRELNAKEQLLSKLREDILQQQQMYEEELSYCKQRNNQIILTLEEDHTQKMNLLRNELLQQFEDRYSILKLQQEEIENQKAEQIQKIITEKNEIIEKTLNEKDTVLNDFSEQKNQLYNEYTNEKSRLIHINENLLEEISNIRRSMHSTSQSRNSSNKNRYDNVDDDNDDQVVKDETQNHELTDQITIKDKIIALKESEIKDLIHEKDVIQEKYLEFYAKNEELINRVQEISSRNQELIYQNEELSEIFENNQQKIQELSEKYSMRVSEIRLLQDQLNNHNMPHNDISSVPPESLNNTSYYYERDLPQQESFFEKHPAALAAVQASSNSARKHISCYGMSYDDLLKKVQEQNDELINLRQEYSEKQIIVEELQRQLDQMTNQQNEIEFSLMQQQHQINHQRNSSRHNNNNFGQSAAQMSLFHNPSNQLGISEFSMTNFNSTAPVQMTTTFEVQEHPTTDRQDNLAVTGGSKVVQIVQAEAAIAKLKYELEKESIIKNNLEEQNSLLRNDIEELLKQNKNLMDENKNMASQQSKLQTMNQSDLIQSATLEDPKACTPKQQPKTTQQMTPNSKQISTKQDRYQDFSSSPFTRLQTPNEKMTYNNLSTTKKSPSVKKIESKSGFKQSTYSMKEDIELNELLEKHMEMIKELQLKNRQLQEENDQLKESLGKNLDELQLKNDEIQMKYEEKIKQYNSGYLAKYSNLIKENEELTFQNKQFVVQNDKIIQQNNSLKEYNRQLLEEVTREKQLSQEQIKNAQSLAAAATALAARSSPYQSPYKSPIKQAPITPSIQSNDAPTIQINDVPIAERSKTPDNIYSQNYYENSPQFQKFIYGLENQYHNDNNNNNNNNNSNSMYNQGINNQMYFLNDNYSDMHKSEMLSNSNNTSSNNIYLSKSGTKLPPSGQKKNSTSFIFSQSKGEINQEKDLFAIQLAQQQYLQNQNLSGSKSQRNNNEKSRSLSSSNAKNSLLQLKAIASRESPFK